jgi:hypothetical protein
MPAEKLIVFCKAPRPGLVKTRLVPALGAQGACDVYRELVEQVVSRVAQVDSVQLRHTPDDARLEVSRWKRQPAWECHPQGPGDLGERMSAAFESELGTGTDRVVVIGTDTPEILESDIREAFNALRRDDLVIGPSEDGGYWLIGLSEPCPGLFTDMPWGTSEVLGRTLQRAKATGLRVHLLRVLADIDTADDLQSYRQRRARA